MLELNNIVKDYKVGTGVVPALRGVSLNFRKSEFVAVLGPSGCGKTTLLNIIGGLDRYTSGDLKIRDRSTTAFGDRDWDTYRNHSIGFIFQSYNLIPHQTVVENVELALTLSGVSRSERRRRALAVLDRVGLSDKVKSRPNQLSGGQMQRVAIARALINDPEILLADEPTGALDTKTSDQIMEILSEISQDRLIIMVTHNPELAERYASRTIRLIDGLVTDDSNPPTAVEWEEEKRVSAERIATEAAAEAEETARTGIRKKRASMSFLTALSLSFKNLLTKKTRTVLVSVAGSIGIIGIALILSLSAGFQGYINRVQEDTLSSYPLTIQRESVDMTALLNVMMGGNDSEEHDLDKLYSNDVMVSLFQSMMSQTYSNNMMEFKEYLEKDNSPMAPYLSAYRFRYDMKFHIYSPDTASSIFQINPSTLFDEIMGPMASGFGDISFEAWSEMIDNQKLLDSQYEVVEGRWPEKYDEVVVVMDENNEINDYILYSLGLKDPRELSEMMQKLMRGEEVEVQQSSFTYADIMKLEYKLVLPTAYYQAETKEVNGGEVTVWTDKSKSLDGKSFNYSYMKPVVDNGLTLKVVGILRPGENVAATSISGNIAYTSALTKYYSDEINRQQIVLDQRADEETDVFTGLPFVTELSAEDLADIRSMLTLWATLPEYEDYVERFDKLLALDDDALAQEIKSLFKTMGMPIESNSTFESNLEILGSVDLDNPSAVYLYPLDFESKDKIIDLIKVYNAEKTAAGEEGSTIKYTDYIGLMMSSISTIINAISYVLIGFVSISLIVSSIMIGIITYISVLERIKEIGILRAVGASKRDISRVFNAETLIIGFGAGGLGILITLLFTIPINLIIKLLTGIAGIAALPWLGAVGLILISMVLTLISGLIPARIAAKKDPVVALRTE